MAIHPPAERGVTARSSVRAGTRTRRKPVDSTLRKILRSRLGAGVLLAALTTCGFSARADRSVIGPTGDTLAPKLYRAEFALDPEGRTQNRIWLQYATEQGIELEAERYDLTNERKKGYALNIQYPITYSLVNTIPAVSVGVRDLTGTGNEHGAFYLAATKNVSLSDGQHRYLRSLKFDVGAGTGRIGGLFVGAQTQLAMGLRIQAEISQARAQYLHRPPVEPASGCKGVQPGQPFLLRTVVQRSALARTVHQPFTAPKGTRRPALLVGRASLPAKNHGHGGPRY